MINTDIVEQEMFSKETYIARRTALAKAMGKGV